MPGMQLHFDAPPQRVVSLVPSTTESLFDLGLGSAVVGITPASLSLLALTIAIIRMVVLL